MTDLAQERSEVLCFFGFSPEEIEPIESVVIVFHNRSQLIKKVDSYFEVFYDGELCDLHAFKELCEIFCFKQFVYRIHPQIESQEQVHVWVDRCRQIHWQVHCQGSDWQDFGLKAFSNICLERDRSFDGDSFARMAGSCQGMPAIVCGAGPSLMRNIPFLEENSDRGLIFAGGAALGTLSRLGIHVHVGTGVDPDPSYEKNLVHGGFEAPFFYPSRCQASLIDVMQGPKFRVPSNRGYPLAEWLEGLGSFDTGWTAVTFCAALAVHLGCNPIIFIGVDLSIPLEEAPKEEGVIWSDPVRGPVWTKKDWVLSARWLEGLITSNPEISFSTLSTGLTIEGVKDFSPDTLSEQCDCLGAVQALTSFWKEISDNREKLQEMELSIEKSKECLDRLLGLYEENYPEDPREKGAYVLALFDLEEEPFYQIVLLTIWRFWRFSLEEKVENPYARELNQWLFFMTVLEKYKACLCRESCLR